MSRHIAVSFENGQVQVAYGRVRHDTLAVTRTISLSEDEFDTFLTREKAKDFIVVLGFQAFYQDVLFLPPVEEKYLNDLVAAEVKKNAPELKDFVFFFSVLRERLHEGRPAKEIFVFAVDPAGITSIIERFVRHGKRVRRLYADVLAASILIGQNREEQEKAVLAMIDRGSHKILFLLREGNLNFVRVIQSRGKGLDRFDTTNVNMTVNYARQNLREYPEELMIVNAEGHTPPAQEGLTLALAPFKYPAGIIFASPEAAEYALAVGGLLLGDREKKKSLFPKEYQELVMQDRVLRYGAGMFFLVSILCFGYMLSEWNQALQIRKIIAPLRGEIAGRSGVYRDFESRKEKLGRMIPFIHYLNNEGTTPDVQRCLIALQNLSADKVRIKDIEIKNVGSELVVNIRGHVPAATYGELQGRFRRLINSIGSAEGVHGLSEKLDLASKDFSVELKWKN